MSNIIKRNIEAFENDKDFVLPTEFMIFESGDNIASREPTNVTYDPSRKEELQSIYDEEDGRDRLPIDVEHLSLDNQAPIESHVSVGWFKLSFEDSGVWARDVQWTEKGEAFLKNREFRFLSPAFKLFEDMHVRKIVNVAITNIPATVDPEPLVRNNEARYLSKDGAGVAGVNSDSSPKDKVMTEVTETEVKRNEDMKEEAQVEERQEEGAEDSNMPMSEEEMMVAIKDLQAMVAGLEEQLRAKDEMVKELEAKLTEATGLNENMQKETILNNLISEGKMQPFFKRSLMKLSLADVKDSVKDFKDVVVRSAVRGPSVDERNLQSHELRLGKITNVSFNNRKG